MRDRARQPVASPAVGRAPTRRRGKVPRRRCRRGARPWRREAGSGSTSAPARPGTRRAERYERLRLPDPDRAGDRGGEQRQRQQSDRIQRRRHPVDLVNEGLPVRHHQQAAYRQMTNTSVSAFAARPRGGTRSDREQRREVPCRRDRDRRERRQVDARSRAGASPGRAGPRRRRPGSRAAAPRADTLDASATGRTASAMTAGDRVRGDDRSPRKRQARRGIRARRAARRAPRCSRRRSPSADAARSRPPRKTPATPGSDRGQTSDPRPCPDPALTPV